MIDNIISFTLGSIIKIVDDHYDMKIHNKEFIKILKFIGLLGLIYWTNLGIEYNFILLVETIICYFVKQIDNKFYKYVAYYIVLNFLYQKIILKKNVFSPNFTIKSTFINSFITITVILIESKIFKEEYSLRKILCRTIVFGIGFMLYLIILLKLPDSKHNRLIKNSLCITYGYFFISVSDMTVMLLRKNDILN